jgi:uncharacterized delta-60 repeat protein
MAIDSDGSIIITGSSYWDYATVKYDRHGNELWEAIYTGLYGKDNAQDVALDSEGNIYVTGESRNAEGYLKFNYVTIKYDADGNELWMNSYDGPVGERDYARSVAVDGEGNCYVTGYSLNEAEDYQIATVKYDSEGNEEWVAIYNDIAGGDDVPNDITVDGNGHICVTGASVGSGTGPDYITLKYTPGGSRLWAARYDRSGGSWIGDQALAITADEAGNVYVTGVSNDDDTDIDYCTIKYGVGGNVLWTARYNYLGGSDDAANDIAVDSDGNVYVTGESNEDYATIKYDFEGNELWVSRYDGPSSGYDIAESIALDGSGNVYVTGSSSPGFLTYFYATVKYTSEGEEVWAMRYEPPGSNLFATAIAVDTRGDVIVTGEEWIEGGTDSQYTTIKYRQNPLIHREAVPLR